MSKQGSSKKDKCIVIDLDSAIYACGFIAEKKMHYALLDGEVVFQAENKNDYNKWLKEQPNAEAINYDVVVDIFPVSESILALDGYIKNIMELSGSDRRITLLTKGGHCFRTYRATLRKYKGNRDKMVRPVHYDALREHAVKKYGAKVYAKWEADDTAGMIMNNSLEKENATYILAAIDKDLDQFECWHCNPNKPEQGVFQVTEFEGWLSFYKQMLMGDASDNVPGLKGIGEAKALKILEGCSTVEELETAVWEQYVKSYGHKHTYVPWWWLPEYDDPEYKDAALVAELREKRPEKELTVPVGVIFQENADLLYMLRSPTDKYVPRTLDVLECGCWVDYPEGIVKAMLG